MDNNPSNLRVIKTARDQDSINQAAQEGLRPLVKLVEQSDEFRGHFQIIQHSQTGEIRVMGDSRRRVTEGFEVVIPWTGFKRVYFTSPFAAYLLPPDLANGERVWVEDLIENFIDSYGGQGGTTRLHSAEAIWNGQELRIQYNTETDTRVYKG